MRKIILLSAVLVPILIGVVASLDSRPRRGLFLLVASVGAFEFVNALLLYYVWLRLSD